jgi:geranylgeranyl diphosphate synthase type I
VDVEDLRTRVWEALEDFLDRQRAVLHEVSPDCVPMVTHVADLLRTGKRLRPAFCYWGWRAAGGPSSRAALVAAASLEFFQAAALIHDDVMDGSDTRRGMPSVHRRFHRLHLDGGWAGDPDRFGLAGAVLAGDLCLVWSDELLTGSGLPAESLARGRTVFDRMRTELMGGQYLDVLEQALAGRGTGHPVDRARRVIRYKSAKYSVEQPLLLGGRLAGVGTERLAAYSAFGLPLGEAFQLRDDVLGVFGDPVTTGKPAGDDLREGKRTVLVAMALKSATPTQLALVTSLLGDPELDPAGVEALREVLVDTGALAAVEKMIDELTEQAHRALDLMEPADPARAVLTELVTVATARTS